MRQTAPFPNATPQVIYGLDFPAAQRAAQLAAVRTAILDHVSGVRDPVGVIEEYDKLDCPMRGFFRQILENGAIGNVTLNR